MGPGVTRRLGNPHLFAFLGLAAFVVLFSWPLPTCFAECLGDSVDPMFSAWNFAWITRSLTQGAGPLLDGNLFYPYRQTLALGEPSLVNALIALPAIAVTGNPIVGHNVVVLFSLAMAGFGAYLLVWDLTGRRAPALFGGVVFAASPFLIHNAFNIQSLSCYWLPFVWLAIERFRRRPTWAGAALVWTIATLLAASSVYYTMYGGIILAIMFGVGVVVLRQRWSAGHFLKLATVAPPFIAIVLAIYFPYLAWSNTGQATRSIADAAAVSAHAKNFFMAPRTNVLHQRFGWFIEPNPSTSPLYPGMVAGILAMFGAGTAIFAMRGRATSQSEASRRSFAHAIALISAVVLSLGPILVVAGQSLPLPYQWLYWILPPMRALRTPNRFGGPLQLSVAVLAGVGLAVIDRHLSERRAIVARRFLWVVAPVLLLVEFATAPFPGATQHYPTPPMAQRAEVIEWLTGLKGRGAVLELPVPRQGIQLYEAMLHGKPVVHGVSSFEPPLYHEFINQIAEFPSLRSWRLLRALPVDFLLLSKADYSREALDDIAAHRDVVAFDHELGRHLVYRVLPAHPSFAELSISGRVDGADQPSTGRRLTMVIANNTDHELPFYPLHTVTAVATIGPSSFERQEVKLPLWIGAAERVTLTWQLPPSRSLARDEAASIDVIITSASGATREVHASVPLGHD